MLKKNGVTLLVMFALAVSLFFYIPGSLQAESTDDPPLPVTDTLDCDTGGGSTSCIPSDNPEDESIIDIIIDLILGQD